MPLKKLLLFNLTGDLGLAVFFDKLTSDLKVLKPIFFRNNVVELRRKIYSHLFNAQGEVIAV